MQCEGPRDILLAAILDLVTRASSARPLRIHKMMLDCLERMPCVLT